MTHQQDPIQIVLLQFDMFPINFICSCVGLMGGGKVVNDEINWLTLPYLNLIYYSTTALLDFIWMSKNQSYFDGFEGGYFDIK